MTVVNHYARDDEAHTDLGRTNGGTPIKLDTRFVTADFKVVVGLVEPHFMAGFSGGRKLITPGIAHANDDISGTNDLPLKPMRVINRSIKNAARAM